MVRQQSFPRGTQDTVAYFWVQEDHLLGKREPGKPLQVEGNCPGFFCSWEKREGKIK